MKYEWTKVKIGDVATIHRGSSPRPIQKYLQDTGMPWVKIADATSVNSRYIYSTNACISMDGVKDSVHVAKETLIVSNSATPGLPKIMKIEACVHDGWLIISDFNDILRDYLYYCFVDIRKRLVNHANGSVFQNLKTDIVREFEILLPPIKEQKKIVSILLSLDEKIEINNKIINNLELMVRAIFKSWFVDFDPWGGEMPSSWSAVNLGDLCTTVTKGTTPTTLNRQFVEQGINFIKAESILSDHSIDFTKLAYIDVETNSLLNRSVIQADDIIFTIAGTLGRFAFVGTDLIPGNTNQAVAIIRADISKIKPIILYSFFIGGIHSDFYTQNIQQAVQANLSLATIKALPLFLPPTETITEYQSIIEPLLRKIFLNQAENRSIISMRDAVLPRLMSGELNVDAIDAENSKFL